MRILNKRPKHRDKVFIASRKSKSQTRPGSDLGALLAILWYGKEGYGRNNFQIRKIIGNGDSCMDRSGYPKYLITVLRWKTWLQVVEVHTVSDWQVTDPRTYFSYTSPLFFKANTEG